MGSTSKGRGWHGDPAGHARAGRLGGQVSGGNFKNRPSEEAREAAKKSGGNFALNRQRAVAAGRIGGSRSSKRAESKHEREAIPSIQTAPAAA